MTDTYFNSYDTKPRIYEECLVYEETCREILIDDLLQKSNKNFFLVILSPHAYCFEDIHKLKLIKNFSKKCFKLYSNPLFSDTTRKKVISLFDNWEYFNLRTNYGTSHFGVCIKFNSNSVKDFTTLTLSIFLGIVRQTMLMYIKNEKIFRELNEYVKNIKITSNKSSNKYLVELTKKISKEFIADPECFPLMYTQELEKLNNIGMLLKRKNKNLIDYLHRREVYAGDIKLSTNTKLEELKELCSFGIYSLLRHGSYVVNHREV